jgi:uncharacterized membrane protein
MTTTLACYLVLLVAAAHWLMPSLVPPTVPFGVRIPAERRTAPVIAEQRVRYRIGTVIVAVACLVVVLAAGQPIVLAVTMIVQVLIGAALYLRARAVILSVKAREDWYGGRRQVTVAETGLRTSPERWSWPWQIPSVAVLVATVVIAVLRYPSMPDPLATHFGADGTPDHFVAKSVAAAFSVVVPQVVTTLLFGGLSFAVLRIHARLDTEDPDASTKHRRFVSAMSRALLALALGTNLTLLATALQVWNVSRPRGAAVLLNVVPVLVGILAVVAVAVRTGQGGTRLTIAGRRGPVAEGGAVNPDDDRQYKWGLFYFNRDDPAILAPKRFGVGWTVNLARPATWGMLLAGAGAAVAAVLIWTRP